ncbi:exonuclease domain-containing protein, partial [Chloroflexota bacterium]
MDEIFISLDLETTGLNTQTDKIIDVGVVKFNSEQVLDKFQTLVNPDVEIPYFVQLLTGITPEQITSAPSVGVILPQLEDFIDNYPLVGHNISFDISFLESNGLLLSNKIYDTFELANLLFPQAKDFRLQSIATALGINSSIGHRALPDAMTAMNVFNLLMERADELPPGIISECIRLTEKAEWAFRDLFLNIQTRNTPLAGKLKPDSIMGWLLPYVADERWKEIPVLKPRGKGETLDVTRVINMFEPGGTLSQGLSSYEYRKEQAEMAKSVTESLNESQNLIIEAGTGTGKSLAYVVPASLFAIHNQTRIVISSNNINLQEQLLSKDVPDLVRCPRWALEDLRATALKGRANYLCLRRWNMLRQSNSLTLDEIRMLLRTIIWLATTDTGDRAELILLPGESDIWKQICSQEENCIGRKCQYNKRYYCFLYSARRRAEKAHLIITNHSLVLSDLSVGNQVIPQYQYLIIDEAHHLEDEATNQFGFNISENILLEYLNYMSRRLGGNVYAGFLAGIKAKSKAQNGVAISQFIDMLHNLADDGRQNVGNFFSELVSYILTIGNVSQEFEKRIRLTRESCNNSKWHKIQISLEPLLSGLKDITGTMSKLHSCLEELGSDIVFDYDNNMAELFSLITRGEDFWNNLNSVVINPGDEMINWVVLNK